MSTSVRVATWNIREAVDVETGKDFRVEDLISDLEIDILAIQEMPLNSSTERSLTASLAAKAGLQHSTAFALYPAQFRRGRSGVATFSRYPQTAVARQVLESLGHSVVIDGKHEPMHSKGALLSKCLLPSGDAYVWNMHLFPFHRLSIAAGDPIFSETWAKLRGNLVNKETIVLGDFNTPDRNLLTLESSLVRHVGDRVTHAGFASDDILATSDFAAISCQLIDNPSDHVLCVVELERW